MIAEAQAARTRPRELGPASCQLKQHTLTHPNPWIHPHLFSCLQVILVEKPFVDGHALLKHTIMDGALRAEAQELSACYNRHLQVRV